jgi:hypothetical protein
VVALLQDFNTIDMTKKLSNKVKY